MQANNVPIQENQELEVKIESVGEKGDGIARVKGFVLFVPGTSQGEYVRIRVKKVLKNVGFADLIKKIDDKNKTKNTEFKPLQKEKKKDEIVNKELDIELDPNVKDTDDFGEDLEDFEP